MLAFAICHVLEDLAGSRARRRPPPVPDLRRGARLAARCRSAVAAGRVALRGAAGAAGACVVLAVLALPLLWDAVR